MKKKYYFLILFNIISFLLLIASYVLLLLQNIININFYIDKTKDIIAERFIYEQFSHEIYSNIKSKIIYDIQIKTKKENCESGYGLLKFPLKIETFYDCENIDNNIINKEVCQNTITSSSLCCKPECCRKYVDQKIEFYSCRKKYYFNEIDQRDNICSKISKYNGKFYYLKDNKFCVKKLEKNYEELLSEFYEPNNDRYHYNSDDIIYDSIGHSFNKQKYNISINSNYSVKNIFSVNKPFFIEMENSIRISTLLNQKNYDESKVLTELKKFNEISESNIKEAFKTSLFDLSKISNPYTIYHTFNLSDLISSDEIVFDNFKGNTYIKNGTISWYYRNYIGFDDIDELRKFKKYFDENDNKNNSLYKLANSLVAFLISIVSIIIIFILFIAIIIYLIYIISGAKRSNSNVIDFPYEKISISISIISIIIFAIFLIIYLSCFICYYDHIDIKMEIFYVAVLDKYNERRNQFCLLCAILISFLNFLLSDILYLIEKYLKQKGLAINIKPDNILFVKFRLNQEKCEHKIKLDKNKIFANYFKTFEKILEKCKRCKDNFYELRNITLNGNRIDFGQNIGSVDINEESILIINDEN